MLSGSVHVYVSHSYGHTWSETQKLLASDGEAGDEFGVRVAMHSGIIVAGSWLDDNEKGPTAGDSA